MSDKPEVDDISGTETTGHEWDGVKELNTPLPKWWLYVFYVTVIWSVFFIFTPALIGDNAIINANGFFGTSQREYADRAVAEAEAGRAKYMDAIATSDFAAIQSDEALMEVAMAAGEAAFGGNCAPCHGSGAQGFPGFPNLNDDAWLWGGSVEDIQYTLNHGIRWSTDDDTRFSQMPAFGWLGEDAVEDAAAYVQMLAGLDGVDTEAAGRGSIVYAENCVICHAEEGTGDRSQGAPNLTDAVWLYGSDVETIKGVIANGPGTNGLGGVMPGWQDRLDAATIKSLTLYVHALGGGE